MIYDGTRGWCDFAKGSFTQGVSMTQVAGVAAGNMSEHICGEEEVCRVQAFPAAVMLMLDDSNTTPRVMLARYLETAHLNPSSTIIAVHEKDGEHVREYLSRLMVKLPASGGVVIEKRRYLGCCHTNVFLAGVMARSRVCRSAIHLLTSGSVKATPLCLLRILPPGDIRTRLLYELPTVFDEADRRLGRPLKSGFDLAALLVVCGIRFPVITCIRGVEPPNFSRRDLEDYCDDVLAVLAAAKSYYDYGPRQVPA
jgi:hypothetical protein